MILDMPAEVFADYVLPELDVEAVNSLIHTCKAFAALWDNRDVQYRYALARGLICATMLEDWAACRTILSDPTRTFPIVPFDDTGLWTSPLFILLDAQAELEHPDCGLVLQVLKHPKFQSMSASYNSDNLAAHPALFDIVYENYPCDEDDEQDNGLYYQDHDAPLWDAIKLAASRDNDEEFIAYMLSKLEFNYFSDFHVMSMLQDHNNTYSVPACVAVFKWFVPNLRNLERFAFMRSRFNENAYMAQSQLPFH